AGKFNMVFQFEHLDLWGKSVDGGIDIHALRETFEKWQKGLHNRGWNALFLENHDQPRSVSTWGNSEAYWKESAKALATFYFLMQGTPFIYQGQEIGMTNVRWKDIHDYNRSEEHTSELQSRFDLVCRLLLEKKNITQITNV